jgi:transposase
LPNTLDLAHQKILDQEKIIQNCYQAIADLTQQLKLAKARQFGRSADTFVDPNAPTQDHLFDEAEILELMGELVGLVQTAAEAAASEAEKKVQVPAYERTINRGKRQPLPAYLARVETVYELSPEELIGPNGERFEPIGFEISEQLNIIPQEIYVLLHKRMNYS